MSHTTYELLLDDDERRFFFFLDLDFFFSFFLRFFFGRSSSPASRLSSAGFDVERDRFLCKPPNQWFVDLYRADAAYIYRERAGIQPVGITPFFRFISPAQ